MINDTAFPGINGSGLTKLEYVATHLSLGPIPPSAAEQLVGPQPEDQSNHIAMAMWAAQAMATDAVTQTAPKRRSLMF